LGIARSNAVLYGLTKSDRPDAVHARRHWRNLAETPAAAFASTARPQCRLPPTIRACSSGDLGTLATNGARPRISSACCGKRATYDEPFTAVVAPEVLAALESSRQCGGRPCLNGRPNCDGRNACARAASLPISGLKQTAPSRGEVRRWPMTF
jgi:hypothetical protein